MIMEKPIDYIKQWSKILAAFNDGDLAKARALYDDVADRAWRYDGLTK